MNPHFPQYLFSIVANGFVGQPFWKQLYQRALSIQQKSPVQIFGIFAGRMDRVRPLPKFEITCSATQGMLGETLLCLKMVNFLKILAASEQHDFETISCTILYRNEHVILLAAIACFMRRELTRAFSLARVNGYFEVTIPGHLSGELENHFLGKRPGRGVVLPYIG